MRVLSCIATAHNPWLVILAACVCVSGSWVAFGLIQRALDRQDLQKAGWVFLASVAAGSSVWCTHFIAMLAYSSQAPVAFEPLMTMASLLVAIAGSGLGISIAVFRKGAASPVLGGGVLGAAIAAMHFTGMLAYHVDGLIVWDSGYVVVSVIFAVGLCALAFDCFVRGSLKYPHTAALVLFVGAVVSLHFTAMTAMSVIPFVTGAPVATASDMQAMAVAVAGVGLLVVATGVASHLIDSRANSETVERLQQLALNDALTGLPNRVSFNNHLARDLSHALSASRKVAVLAIDLDRFKEINDLRGHHAGDQALIIVANRLKGLLRDGEFVARIGGDEFAAAKRYDHHSDLVDFAGRIETALFTPIRVDDFESVAGASIGVATYPQDGDTQERLTCNADLAMYRAKLDVTRAVCFYESNMDEAARARRNLAQDLRRAIDHKQLELYYQVQTSVATGDVSGYEVLLRWNHPQLGKVPPSEFIPLAEETGSILAIGDWVLKTACVEAATWKSLHKIAVNISAMQLLHVDLPQRVQEILLESGLSPSRLELEITETTVIADKQKALLQLARIRALGVTVAIDDFGTGYSSFDTLRCFPFDKIKLDRSFMSEIETSPQAAAIVRAVLTLGKSLDIPILAEGVETSDQLEILKREGCDEAQGYFLGRPSPIGIALTRESSGEPNAAVAA